MLPEEIANQIEADAVLAEKCKRLYARILALFQISPKKTGHTCRQSSVTWPTKIAIVAFPDGSWYRKDGKAAGGAGTYGTLIEEEINASLA